MSPAFRWFPVAVLFVFLVVFLIHVFLFRSSDVLHTGDCCIPVSGQLLFRMWFLAFALLPGVAFVYLVHLLAVDGVVARVVLLFVFLVVLPLVSSPHHRFLYAGCLLRIFLLLLSF